VLSAACASTPKSDPLPIGPTAHDYAPMAIGQSWTYQVWYPGQKGEMTVSIVGEKDGYLLDSREGAFRLTQDGLRDKQRYLIRHPLTAGATWQTVVSASAVEHNKIISVGERCECAAGSFPDCLVVESRVRGGPKVTVVIRWTWARGIGLVKFETEAEVVGQGVLPQVKQSLIRYGAAPGPTEKNTDNDGAPATWSR
jgi:hypothetical protein